MFQLIQRGLWTAEYQDLVSGCHFLTLKLDADFGMWRARHWGYAPADGGATLHRGELVASNERLARLKIELNQMHGDSWGMSECPPSMLQRRLGASVAKAASLGKVKR